MWGREARVETLAEVRRVRVKCMAARNQESQSRTRPAQWLKTGGGRASISRVPNARNFDLSGVRAKELNVWVNILEKEGDNCMSAGERVGRKDAIAVEQKGGRANLDGIRLSS